ncbi:MAG: hypothetical protein ABSG33_09340 [Candidatus Bathyarchaeia archaeon]|jgi:hypothetical protein
MRSQKTNAALFVLLTLMLLATFAPFLANKAYAQTSGNYWITVKPTGDSQFYTTIGRNWTLSFEAVWSYGSSSGQLVSNAMVAMQVSGEKEGALGSLDLNSTSGEFSFNYSSTTADIITFTPSKVVTQDGTQYSSALMKNSGNQTYGLLAKSVTVWWDTFQVSLVNYNTDAAGTVSVTVNVTYLLLPEAGLTLPAQDTYSNQTFLPKIASQANVAINGITAQETSVPGEYSATVSTAFPTAYVLVAASQNGWTTTHTAFGFTQKANETLWGYGVIIGLILVAILASIFLVMRRKPAEPAAFGRKGRFPLIGGVLLLLTSVFSLYWGAVAVEATLHGFNWAIMAVAGLGAFAFGVLGGVLSLKKKNEALVIFAVCTLLVVNVVVLKYAFDTYALTVPWLFILAATAVSIVSGVLITNSDEQFSKQTTHDSPV